MGTALLALCFCTLSLVLALFVGISPISDKAKIRFMCVGAALSLMAVPMMSHYIAGLNDIVDELRYQAVDEEQGAINACAIAFAERGQILIPNWR